MHYNEGQPFVYTVDVNGRTTAQFVSAFLHAPGFAKIKWDLLNTGTTPIALPSGEVVLLLILNAVTSKTRQATPEPLDGLQITLYDADTTNLPITQPPIQPVVLSTQPGSCDFCPEPPEDEPQPVHKKKSKHHKTRSKPRRSA
jgi:hypothetical protein